MKRSLEQLDELLDLEPAARQATTAWLVGDSGPTR